MFPEDVYFDKVIGTLELKNRVAMAPMGTAGMADADLGYSRRLIDFYAARARGGTGMIITGAAIVNTRLEGGLAHFLPRLDGPQYVSRLSELADAVHHYGAKLVIQLSAGFGRVNYLLGNSIPPISASAVPCFRDPTVSTRSLSTEEIGEIMMSFAMAAAMAKMAGVDGIEIQGYGGYLIDQFQTSAVEQAHRSIRRRSGGPAALPARAHRRHQSHGRSRLPDHLQVHPRALHSRRDATSTRAWRSPAAWKQAGVDALHVDGGCYEVWNRVIPSMYEEPACQIPLAEAVKAVVKLPVIAHGKLGNPEVARQVIEDGKADFVAIGRPLLADPEWTRKVKEGRVEDIRPCIACNEVCLGKALLSELHGEPADRLGARVRADAD